LRKILREIKYYLWALNGFIGLRSRTNASQKAMILFTYFSPARMKHINHQLRNIFKCDFVGQVIISNHNPEIDINSLIKVRDDRITVVNQPVRRGCGHRWLVANEFSPEYLIVVDDDLLIFPRQLRQLFEALVATPEIPHGFAGMVQHEDGFLEYRQEEELSLDYICEIYALTGVHMKRFMELREEVIKDESLRNMVESAADFMIVSRSGSRAPMIHDAGRLFRCPTYNEMGVAVHKDNDFNSSMMGVARALNAIASSHPTTDSVPMGGTYGSN
jgi:hypothetical protein